MKKALALLCLALTLGFSGVGVSPIVQADALEDLDNQSPYVILDTDEALLSYDSVCGAPYVEGVSVPTSGIGEYKIIGFNTDPDFVTISSLTVRVQYYVPSGFLNLGKTLLTKTFTYNATKKFMVYGQDNLNNHSFWSPLDAIGQVSDLIEFETGNGNILPTYYLLGLGYFQPSKQVSVEDSVIGDDEWYIVLPFMDEFKTTYISIAGSTFVGDIVSDGTNGGIPFSDEYGDFIGFEAGVTPRSCTFNSEASVSMIVVESFVPGTDGRVYIDFGDYDFENEYFKTVDFRFDYGESIDVDLTVVVPYDHQAIVTFSEGSSGIVKIYYEAEVPATHNNIVDLNGHERPSTISPHNTSNDDGDDGLLWLILGCLGLAAMTFFIVVLVERISGASESIQRSKYFRSKRKYHR